jgi:hypothetical protein
VIHEKDLEMKNNGNSEPLPPETQLWLDTLATNAAYYFVALVARGVPQSLAEQLVIGLQAHDLAYVSDRSKETL